jgi:hypothetical protein
MLTLCAPAVIYIIFSIIQILFDLSYGMLNTAIMKFMVAIIITFLLNWLCQKELTIVSWVIVFIPFMLMTFIVAFLLYIFGLNATTGQLNNTCKSVSQENLPPTVKIDINGNLIIYDPEYNAALNPVHYKYPNIIVPNPYSNDKLVATSNKIIANAPPLWYSSSPAFTM